MMEKSIMKLLHGFYYNICLYSCIFYDSMSVSCSICQCPAVFCVNSQRHNLVV